MNNLRKFATEAEYSAATLNYPAVSWIVSGDTLHYDKEAAPTPPTPSAPAIKVAFTMDSCGNGKSVTVIGDVCVCDAISAITVNGVDYDPTNSTFSIETTADTDYLIEYILKGDATEACYGFSYISTPWGCASSTIYYDILFPEQITDIGSLNTDQINNIIILAETPPTVQITSSGHGEGFVYVPDASVNSYITAWHSVAMDDYIKPLSEYEGNIPLS